MSKGIKRFIYAISVFALIVVGVCVSSPKMSAKEFIRPEGVATIDVENVEQLYDNFDMTNGRITWQALAIPKEYTTSEYLASTTLTTYFNTNGVNMEYLLYTNASIAIDAINSHNVEDLISILYLSQLAWSFNQIGEMETIINDDMNINNWSVIKLYPFTDAGNDGDAGKRIYLLLLNKLIGQAIPTGAIGVGVGQLDYQLGLLIDENKKTRQLVIIDNNNAMNINEGAYNLINYHSLLISDSDYWYFPTNFNFIDSDNPVSYANRLPTTLSNYLLENDTTTYDLIANTLQGVSDLFPNCKIAFKYEKLGDNDTTYQQGYQLGWDIGYNQGVQDTSGKTFKELGWYNWIIGIFETMGMFLSLKIGDIYIGYFAVIPLIISVVAFIIRMWKGGQGD